MMFEGQRETCWLCDARWGGCSCPDVTVPGFEFNGIIIHTPNVDETGRFFVEPSVYYGQPFTDWWQRIAANEAEAAFWATVARMHPKTRTGDLAPGLAARFTVICKEVVDAWLVLNAPHAKVCITCGRTITHPMLGADEDEKCFDCADPE